MAKPIREVLREGERRRIEEIQKAMHEQSYGRILETVLHIECNIEEQSGIFVATYEALENPYVFYDNTVRARGLSEEELIAMRAQILKGAKSRQEMLRKELAIRSDPHIRDHKYYASKVEDRDLGLIMASALWLKEFGDEFYRKSEEHYRSQGSDFKWFGMEKAIVIAAPDKQGKETHFVIVNYTDLTFEENMAQRAGGIADGRSGVEIVHQKAKLAREKLIETHDIEHFCILDLPDKKYDRFYGRVPVA